MSVINRWYNDAMSSTRFKYQLQDVAEELHNDKHFIQMINNIFISPDEPVERLDMLINVINDRCIEPEIKSIARITRETFELTGGIVSLYNTSHAQIKQISANKLVEEFKDVFGDGVLDVLDTSIIEDYFGISISQLIRKFNPKSILLWYYEKLTHNRLKR